MRNSGCQIHELSWRAGKYLSDEEGLGQDRPCYVRRGRLSR